MARLFPELAAVRVSRSWMGFVAYTFDKLPHIGCKDGIHFAMGYCGSGIAMASYLGMRLGQQILGKSEGEPRSTRSPLRVVLIISGAPGSFRRRSLFIAGWTAVAQSEVRDDVILGGFRCRRDPDVSTPVRTEKPLANANR